MDAGTKPSAQRISLPPLAQNANGAAEVKFNRALVILENEAVNWREILPQGDVGWQRRLSRSWQELDYS